ncbi:MAG: signal transduction histidine kinase [Arenicella sp.]|jgi:signal transduction histidine kinase
MGNPKGLWLKLINSGVRTNYGSFMPRRARLLNASLLVTFILCLLLALNAFISGRIPNAFIQLTRSLLIVIAYYFSSKGWHKSAFLGMIAVLLVGNLAFLIFQPYNVGNSYTFLVLLILLYYFLKDDKEVVIYYLFIGLLGIAHYYYEETYMEVSPINIRIISYVSILLLTFFILKFFRDELRIYQNEVAEKQSELESINEKTEQQNGQLVNLNEELNTVIENEKATSVRLEMANAKLNAMQEQVVQSEKMNSLGQMVKGTIGQLSNPLNFISGGVDAIFNAEKEVGEVMYAYKKLHKISDIAQMETALKEIRDLEEELEMEELLRDVPEIVKDTQLGVKQMMDLLHSLTTFTEKIAKQDLIPTNLQDLIEEVVGKIPKEHQIRLEVSIDQKLKEVNIAPSFISRSITHLLENALQASTDKVLLKVWKMGKNWALSVTDSGSGMSEEVIKKAREPFYTTKGESHKGLGLSIVSHVVLQHGGKMEIQSEESNGTAIFLTIPTHHESPSIIT